MSAAVPVTIITGFLGSGKTTLLNWILTQPHGKKIAVIENEFGENIGIESLIAKEGVNGDVLDGFYELSNGCVCCTVQDDLVATLERILATSTSFDYILVETTGVANPGPVASMFWVDPELEGRLRLDGIVTCVDASTVTQFTSPGHESLEFQAQIAYADRILLNKQDLVSSSPDSAQDDILACVHSINGLAPVQWTSRSQVDLDFLLDLDAFDATRVEQLESHFNHHSVADDDDDDVPGHLQDISTCCLTLETDVSVDQMEAWLGEKAWENPDCPLYRMKGVLAIRHEAFKYILQGVGDLFEITPSQERWMVDDDDDDVRRSKIIVIGKGLEERALQASLENAVAKRL